MNYLHVAIIEDTEACLVSHTESGLRSQVTESLAARSINAMNDSEWADCVKGQVDHDQTADCLPFGAIYYYKTAENLGKKEEIFA